MDAAELHALKVVQLPYTSMTFSLLRKFSCRATKPEAAWWFVGCAAVCIGLACQSQEQNILGTFELDVEVGCEGCEQNGPVQMSFDDESPSVMLGGYRFEFAEGQFHEGLYEFVYFDSSSQLVLYPEEASADHFGLIGTTLQTDYSVGFNAIRERCNGVLNCVWKRNE